MPYSNQLPVISTVTTSTTVIAVDGQLTRRVSIDTIVNFLKNSGLSGSEGPMGPFGPEGPRGPSGPRGIPGTIKVDTIPTSSTSTGVQGNLAVTTTSLYLCVSTNTWVKVNLAPF